jgi:AcrR family transcriptional regulator
MRTGYHHGNLKDSAIEAGYRVARERGIEQVALREVATLCGVAPSAVYRHFGNLDELVTAISAKARQGLSEAMNIALEANGQLAPSERMRLAGRAYIRFALDNPADFRVAFQRPDLSEEGLGPESPWGILQQLSDELAIELQWQQSTKVPGKIFAWAAVHGLATLIVDGAIPPETDAEILVESSLEMILKALSS